MRHKPRETLDLPPLPSELRHLVNPYLDPRGAIDVHRQQTRVSPKTIAMAAERLSKQKTSRALQLHESNVTEVLRKSVRGPSSRPCSRSSGRGGSASPPPTLAYQNQRFYAAPLAAQTQLKAMLERKHVAPVGSSSNQLMTPDQLSGFLERNVSRPQSRAESRQRDHRASIAALQRKLKPREDHVEHFYSQQVQQAKDERDRLMDVYAKCSPSRPLSPADQRRSAERLSSAGKS